MSYQALICFIFWIWHFFHLCKWHRIFISPSTKYHPWLGNIVGYFFAHPWHPNKRLMSKAEISRKFKQAMNSIASKLKKTLLNPLIFLIWWHLLAFISLLIFYEVDKHQHGWQYYVGQLIVMITKSRSIIANCNFCHQRNMSQEGL